VALTRFSTRTLNFMLLVAIFAATTFWILQFSSSNQTDGPVVAVPTSDRAARNQVMDVAPIAALFGSREAPAAFSADITIAGVIAEGGKGQGVALLSVNNLPAMAFRAGDRISDQTTLREVKANGVVIENGGIAREILLPAREPPSGIEPAK
jgi:hypothetical protein